MIYVSAVYANAERTLVTGTDALGQTETRSIDNPHELRREDEFITGFLASGGVIADYATSAVDPWDAVRAKRDALLKETDWYTLRAWEQGNDLPPDIAEYRQSLRDITLQPDPLNLVWPNEPI